MQEIIEKAWDKKEVAQSNFSVKPTVEKILEQLDSGKLRVAEKIDGQWVTHSWIKKAILMSFSLYENSVLEFGKLKAFDKIPLKYANYKQLDFNNCGTRVVPGAIVRYSSFVGKNVVLMPSFVNVGANIGDGTLIDTWATVGSCAQVGTNCHISGGVGLGGVLEPLQANPVIIEDNVFIGARSEIVEGVIVSKGSVISMGVYIGASTRIYNRQTGEIIYGKVPEYSVVVPGTLPSSDGKTHTYAAIIVKKVDEETRKKTKINELLRGND